MIAVDCAAASAVVLVDDDDDDDVDVKSKPNKSGAALATCSTDN